MCTTSTEAQIKFETSFSKIKTIDSVKLYYVSGTDFKRHQWKFNVTFLYEEILNID